MLPRFPASVKPLCRPLFPCTRTWTSLTRNPDSLTVHSLNNTTFPYVWLRDSSQAPDSIHPTNRQKLHRTSDIPLDVAPLRGNEGVQVTPHGLQLCWNDGHQSLFDKAWLERYASPDRVEKFHMDDHLREVKWSKEILSSTPTLFQDYDGVVNTDKGLLAALTQLVKCGIVFIRGVPISETSEERWAGAQLSERFGEMRRTFYGLTWDVVSRKDSVNIAYTNLDLGLHMDMLYMGNAPRQQILHCLRTKVVGGTSIFSDAIHAADILRETHPSDFEILAKTPIAFHYINDGHHLHQERCTIELDRNGRIAHINYAPPFQAPLPLSTPKEFYPALKRFTALVNDEANTFRYTLREGDAVIFDNRKVLHGRTSFRDRTPEEATANPEVQPKEGEPSRWLKGTFIEPDSLLDRARVLRAKLSVVA